MARLRAERVAEDDAARRRRRRGEQMAELKPEEDITVFIGKEKAKLKMQVDETHENVHEILRRLMAMEERLVVIEATVTKLLREWEERQK